MKKMEISGFIRLKELRSLLQLSRSTIWRMEKNGTLPAKIQISHRAIGWHRSEIEEFINSRKKVGYVANQRTESIAIEGGIEK